LNMPEDSACTYGIYLIVADTNGVFHLENVPYPSLPPPFSPLTTCRVYSYSVHY
jgi:hypothetical protein